MHKRFSSVLNLLLAVSLVVSLMAMGLATQPVQAGQSLEPAAPRIDTGTLVTDDGPPPAEKVSHRLIVELQSPPAVEWAKSEGVSTMANGRLNLKDGAVQLYIERLKAEQAAFKAELQKALPLAQMGQFINEFGQREALAYQVVFNGVVVEPGSDKLGAMKVISRLPGVKSVYPDRAHDPEMYASLPLINAAAAWDNAVIGGKANAGAGVKFASMDGGVHGKDNLAPMFSGVGYSYPADYPAGGLGLTSNNNGKVISSKVYFRTWDPPSAGDENPWPGTQGTSHGVHTSGSVAGNEVVAETAGYTATISGVAPRAWVMSYRVFYNSITNDGSFYDAEGIAALEDIAMDQPDVLNNSWGGGPGSAGGEFDPLDIALVNAANSGVFVSMSNGNAGPDKGTGDHPSENYINVAASSTAGTIASGKFNVTAPLPISTTLQSMPFAAAAFGGSLPPVGSAVTYTFKTGASVGNNLGCAAYAPGTFTGMAAVIQRGTCEFGAKALNAQNAGAVFVVIFNSAAGGDTLLNMGPGVVGGSVTIPAISTWESKGLGMVSWYNQFGSASVMQMDMRAYQAGATPDIIASFSSRGPGVGMVLKPDIAAPGVNIFSQGYAAGATGEARHLGYGQASGTSMAAPHITGSAALLRQIHPDWSNAQIKSALMTTSKYVGIYNNDGTAAQPLDMGAGRVDLTNAANPGLFVSPQNVSMGQIVTGTNVTRNIWVTSDVATAETYNLSAVQVTAVGYGAPTVAALPGFSVTPSSLTLDAGEAEMITVTFTSAAGSLGDNQGFIVFDGASYDAHMPAWVRNTPPSGNTFLLIDKDGASSGANDFRAYYTTVLTNLGFSYDVVTTVPDGATLAKYDAVLLYTGLSYTTASMSALEKNRLMEYLNQGGKVFAMGQDLSGVDGADTSGSPNGSFFYTFGLGGEWLQDSVTNYALPTLPVVARPDAPPALHNVSIDLTGPKTNSVNLLGGNEVPPVTTATFGLGKFGYTDATNTLSYNITVNNPLGAGSPITITASHIHTGTVGVNGPALYTLFTGPQVVNTTFTFSGNVVGLTAAEETALKAGKLYVNVHTLGFPGGEIRAQVSAYINGDGAGNQFYIDEITPDSQNLSPEPNPGQVHAWMPLFRYPGANNLQDGTTGMAHRAQPSLEWPGISYFGRSIYTTFGLEGVNNGLAGISRENLFKAFVDWSLDEPQVSINATTFFTNSHMTEYTAGLTSNIAGVTAWKYRWDFGDGTPFTVFYQSATVGHTYEYCGFYNVRVEAVDSWGNHAVSAPLRVFVPICTTGQYRVFLPVVKTVP